jgi:hypothetical protein
LNLNRENIHGDVLELLKKAKTDLHEELTRLKKEKFSTDVEIGKYWMLLNRECKQ